MECDGTVRHDMAWHCFACHGMEQQVTTWHGIYGLAWHATVLHTMAWHDLSYLEWTKIARIRWDGMGKDTIEWYLIESYMIK